MNRCGQLEGAGGSDRRSNDGRCLDALTGDHLVLWTLYSGESTSTSLVDNREPVTNQLLLCVQTVQTSR